MKYAYIGNYYDGDGLRKTFGKSAKDGLKKWLVAIIFTEQAYLAENIVIINPDEELTTLLKFCKFFSAVLRDENPEPIPFSDWSLDFEGKHHNLIGMYINFVRRIYKNPKNPYLMSSS